MERNKNNVSLAKWVIDFVAAIVDLVLTGSPIALLLLAVEKWVRKARSSERRAIRIGGKIAGFVLVVAKALVAMIPFIS